MSTDHRSPALGWMLDELATAGRENLDADHVARYDAKMDAEALSEVALLRGLGLGPGSTLVELGAGTGQLTVVAAPVCRRVVAVDVSPPMRSHLSATVERLGLENVDVVGSGFLTYEHVGPPADVVYSRFALHHLPDAWKALALARIHALLRPGGIFRLWDVVYDFGPDEAADRIEAWCATGGDVVDGEWSRAELEEHVRDEHSTYSWLLDAMIDRAGFDVAAVDRTGDGFESRYVLLAR